MENKNKQRKLPEVDIAGHAFYADATRSEYIEVADTQNRIHVLEMMNFDDHSEFLFDHSTRNAYQGRWDKFPEASKVENVWLRPIAATDPEGMRMLISEGKYTWEVHYKTPLPVVAIGGTDFFVDEIRKGFREVANPWNILLYTNTNRDDPWTVYFDKRIKNVPFPHELDKYNPPRNLPAHISRESLPTGAKLNELLKDVITVRNTYLVERSTAGEAKLKNKKGIKHNGK